MHLLIISRYVISKEEDQTLDTDVFKSLKKIKILKKIYVFLFNDENFNLTLGEEDDDE